MIPTSISHTTAALHFLSFLILDFFYLHTPEKCPAEPVCPRATTILRAGLNFKPSPYSSPSPPISRCKYSIPGRQATFRRRTTRKRKTVPADIDHFWVIINRGSQGRRGGPVLQVHRGRNFPILNASLNYQDLHLWARKRLVCCRAASWGHTARKASSFIPRYPLCSSKPALVVISLSHPPFLRPCGCHRPIGDRGGVHPGVVSNLDASGTIITFEANAAAALREIAPDLHMRFMNISVRILLDHFE